VRGRIRAASGCAEAGGVKRLASFCPDGFLNGFGISEKKKRNDD
jgi:hypothetical protein